MVYLTARTVIGMVSGMAAITKTVLLLRKSKSVKLIIPLPREV